MISKIDLDKKICDIEKGCNNTQTYREYIRESEKELGVDAAKLDNFTDNEVGKYLEFIDYLWEK